MLHDSANDDGYVALKQAAEDREGWRYRDRGWQKPTVQQKTTDDDAGLTGSPTGIVGARFLQARDPSGSFLSSNQQRQSTDRTEVF